MRVKSLVAAAAVLVLGAGTAQAGWTFTETVVAGGGAGNEIHRFFAKLTKDKGDELATGLQSVDATMETAKNMKFKFVDTNLDGIPDADIGGKSINDSVGRTSTAAAAIGTFIRPGDPTGGSFFAATTVPLNPESKDIDADGVADPGFDPSVNYAAVKFFRVAAVAQGGKDTKAFSDSSGSLFAMAVVPTGTAVKITGTVASDAGPIVPILIPEPATLGALALGGMLLGRRRRAAK